MSIWFKPKTWGWGYVPASPEGWILTAALVAVMVYTIKDDMPLAQRIVLYAVEILFFIYIADKHSTKPLLFK